MELILAGDIGGTNTRLALFDTAALGRPRGLRVYRSGDYESLQAIIHKFMFDSILPKLTKLQCEITF